ncbi:hypothetical protein KNP414_04653 [Paenibacillus mucilaginosus KNP414]|uniref:Uncharacterized protein n=1 Tax=Paenibacillus mucilaginosus (strain KNP414) TaxID=1036673 RepID=F8FDY3_PAEMK|nr:hypothetical protein KNP414_04653 [Paenibacillus mucilaginosus KNP414]
MYELEPAWAPPVGVPAGFFAQGPKPHSFQGTAAGTKSQ